MIFQNCLKLHSPNSSWNYVWQFWNITLGIYAKCHYKSCYQAYTNFNLHVKLLVPDSKWMVTLNIVTTVYSSCLISRPYSCLFDNSLCFNLWITLVKILSNWPFVCSFWPCAGLLFDTIYIKQGLVPSSPITLTEVLTHLPLNPTSHVPLVTS